MRFVFSIFATMVIAAGLTAFVMSRVPDQAAVNSSRVGPALSTVKIWGYQLQAVKAQLIPDDVDLLVVDYSSVAAAKNELGNSSSARPIVDALRRRAHGRNRIVLCYLSIGEAESYRPYWQHSWDSKPPLWLGPENPAWKGNYDVRFWEHGWQQLILNPQTEPTTLYDKVLRALAPRPAPYLDDILAAGFDGVYLDRVDAFEKSLETLPTAKSHMIAFVSAISNYAKMRRPGFLVVPQNGEALLKDDGYIAAIDAVAKEDLFFGETGDGQANNASETRQAVMLLNRAKTSGKPVFVVEYLSDPKLQQSAAAQLRELGYLGLFAERGLKLPPLSSQQATSKQPSASAPVDPTAP